MQAHEASAQASCESYRGPPSLTNVAYDSGPGRISPLEQISPDDVQLSSSHSMAELQERLLGHLKHADEPADTADVPAGGRAGRTRPARRASRLSLTTTSAGIFQPSHDSTLQPAGVAAAGCGDPQAGVCASGAQHVEGAHVCAPEVARVLDEETVSNSDPDTQGHAAVPERRRVQRRGSRLSCSSPVSAQPAPAAVAGSPQDFANELLHRDPQLEAVLTDSGGDVAHAQMPADGRPMRKAPARRASRLSICHPGDALGDVSAQAVQGGQEQPNEKQGMQVPVAMRVVQQDAAGVQESMPSSHQQPLRRVVRRSSSRLSVASNSGSAPPAAAAAATSASGPAGPALLNSVAALRAEEDALDDNDLGGVKLFRRVVRRSSSRLSAASNTNSPVPSPRPSLGFSGTYQSFSQQYAHDLMMATSPGSMSYRRVLRRSSSRLSATASASAPVSPLVQLADEPRPLPPSLVPATAADIFSTAGELPAELGRSSSAGPAVAMPGLLSTGGRTHSASRLSSSLSGLNHPVLDGILTNAHHPNQPLSRGPSNNGHVLSKLGSRLSQYTSSSNGAATDEHPTLGHAGSIPAKSALGSRPPGVAAEAADSRREWVSAERQLNGSAQQRDGPAAAAASSPRRPPSRRSSLLLVQEEARSMLHDSEVGEATVAAQRVRRAPSRGASCLSQASATRCGEPAEHDGSDADAVAAAAAASLRSPRSPRASVLLVQEESRSLLHDNEVGEATIAAQQVRRAPSRRASCLSHVSSTAAEVPSQTSDAAAVPASSSGLQPKSRRSSIVIVQEETRHMLHDSEVGEATLAAQRVRRAPSRRASCLSQASMTASADHGSHCGAHSSQVERVAAEDRPTAGDPADERNRTRRQPQRRGSRLYLAAGGSSGSSQHDSLHDTAVAAGAVSPAVGEVAKEMQRLTADPDAGEFTNALSSSRARSKSRRSSLLSVCSRQSSSRFPDEQLQPASSSSRSPHAAAVEKILQECKDGQSDPANEACTSPRRTGRARRSSRLASATSSVDGSSERGSERSPHSPSNSSVGARPPSISKLIAESQAFSADPDAAGTSDAAASAQATAQASAKKKSRRPSRLASSVSEPDSPIGTLMCEDLTAAVKRLEGYLNQDPDAEITPAAADATPPPALTPRKSRRLSRLSVASNDGEGVVGGVGGVSGDGSVTPQNGQLAAASRRNSSQLSPRKDNPDLQLLRHQVAHSAAGTRDQSPDRPGAAGHPDSPSHSRSLSRLRIARFSAEPTTERSLSQGGAVTPHDIVIAGTLIEKARRASLLSFVPAIKRAEGPPSATQVDSPKGSRSFLRTVSFDTEGKEAKPATDLVKSGGSSRDGPDNAEAVDVASRHGNEPVGSAAAACKQLQVWLEAGQYDKIMGRTDLILAAGAWCSWILKSVLTHIRTAWKASDRTQECVSQLIPQSMSCLYLCLFVCFIFTLPPS